MPPQRALQPAQLLLLPVLPCLTEINFHILLLCMKLMYCLEGKCCLREQLNSINSIEGGREIAEKATFTLMTLSLLSQNAGNVAPNAVQKQSELNCGYFDASGDKDSEQIHCVEEELHNSNFFSSATESKVKVPLCICLQHNASNSIYTVCQVYMQGISVSILNSSCKACLFAMCLYSSSNL